MLTYFVSGGLAGQQLCPVKLQFEKLSMIQSSIQGLQASNQSETKIRYVVARQLPQCQQTCFELNPTAVAAEPKPGTTRLLVPLPVSSKERNIADCVTGTVRLHSNNP